MRLEDHLARHRLADLFLDTLPYNAHTTASDALWVGLPVLTCMGNAFAGRVAASLLNAIGLPELVTHSIEDYEALALRLAKDPAHCSKDIATEAGTKPADASFVRHRPLPTPHRGGLSSDVGDLAAGEQPRSFAVEARRQHEEMRELELSQAVQEAVQLHQQGRFDRR